MSRKLTEKVRDIFNASNIDVNTDKEIISIWYGITTRPRAYNNIQTQWIPYSGGPLYGDQALDHCAWLVNHIEKYRELLPKRIRDYSLKIVKI